MATFNLCKKHTNRGGFAIVEILVVLAIIAILTLTITPQFTSYSTRTKLQDIVVAAEAMKGAVNTCIISQGAVTDCDSGTNGVPPSYNGPAGSNLGSVSVTNGVITATASNNNGLSGQTAVLTPTLASNNTVTWCLTGSNDAGLPASCSGGSGFSCSGNTCTYNGTTYTMWPDAQTGYVMGSVANYVTMISGHTNNELAANATLFDYHNGGDLRVFSTSIFSCSSGVCDSITLADSSGAVVGTIYSVRPGDDDTPIIWQTTPIP